MSAEQSDKNVTIYDIAARAKTSASTVGAVMNGTWQARRISKTRATAIKALADEMGYSPNMQAIALRRERSRIVGMILPMYDNRYFGAIAEVFESMARDRGLFPMVSCTRRDPELELQTVRQMLTYQVERIICTGATDPDSVAALCAKRGVPTLNLDLPGADAISVISDNYRGAVSLTEALIERAQSDDFLFVGGRPEDHNTKARLRGFRDALCAARLTVPPNRLMTCGYAAPKAEIAFDQAFGAGQTLPSAIFVNSNTSLEGVLRWFQKTQGGVPSSLTLGCFDWDPIAAAIGPETIMVRQDVPEMMRQLFDIIDGKMLLATRLIEVPPILLARTPLKKDPPLSSPC